MIVVQLTPAAVEDLADITRFIVVDSPSRAASFVQELVEACEGLADHPERFAMLDRYEHKALRRRPIGQYLIVYRILNSGVEVIRVLSAWQDLDDALDGL